MPEFLELIPPNQARSLLLARYGSLSRSETIDTTDALGRVTSQAVIAPYNLPSFARSTVDGYALYSQDSYGASESLPAYLYLAGEVPMGSAAEVKISRGQCALIHTGGMIPDGADAVVMVEHTQVARDGEIEINRGVAPGENVLSEGEDVSAGQTVIHAGQRIRPAEIGGLMALGFTIVNVKARPKVAIISSGDEVIPPSSELAYGQVRDVNSYTLSALVEGAGGAPVRFGIVPDRAEAMRSAIEAARESCDLVVITAGSSASARDLTSEVINQVGNPGVLVHGVNVRPGKPTILADCDGKPIIGLPGNPVSAYVIAKLFVIPLVETLLGLGVNDLKPSIRARLNLNLASQAGREDWIAVKIDEDSRGVVASPVFGRSNLIFTLARADGMIRIPPDATGLDVDDIVEVYML